jgi:hypothetical protein
MAYNLSVGSSIKLSLSDNGVSTSTLSFQALTPHIATIDSTGVVTALQPGQAGFLITNTADGSSFTNYMQIVPTSPPSHTYQVSLTQPVTLGAAKSVANHSGIFAFQGARLAVSNNITYFVDSNGDFGTLTNNYTVASNITSVGFYNAQELALASDGNFYTNTFNSTGISKITPAGVVSTVYIAGANESIYALDFRPQDNKLYVCIHNTSTGTEVIRPMSLTGVVGTDIPWTGGTSFRNICARTSDGNLYVNANTSTVWQVTLAGTTTSVANVSTASWTGMTSDVGDHILYFYSDNIGLYGLDLTRINNGPVQVASNTILIPSATTFYNYGSPAVLSNGQVVLVDGQAGTHLITI